MTPLQELIGGGHKVQLKAKMGEWLMTEKLGDSPAPGKATLCQRSLPSRHDEWKVAQPWGSEGVAPSAIQAVVLGKLLFPRRLQETPAVSLYKAQSLTRRPRGADEVPHRQIQAQSLWGQRLVASLFF